MTLTRAQTILNLRAQYYLPTRAGINVLRGVFACLTIGVCLWAFSWTSPNPEWAAHARFQMAVVFGFISICYFGAGLKLKVNKWWAMFLGLSLISLSFSGFRSGWVGNIPVSPTVTYSLSAFNFVAISLGVFWYFMLINVFDVDSVHILMDAMCIIAIANIIFLCFQSLGYDPINNMKTSGIGFTARRGDLTVTIAVCSAAFLRKNRRLGVIMCILAFALLRSGGGVFMLCCGGVVYLALTWHWCVAIVFPACLCGFYLRFVDTPYASLRVRWEIVQLAFERLQEHWLFGYGPGHWGTVFFKLYHEKITRTCHWRAHNEFLHMTLELGVMFPLLVIGYLVDIIRKVTRGMVVSITALTIMIAACLIMFPFHIPNTAILFITWLAIIDIQIRENLILERKNATKEKVRV